MSNDTAVYHAFEYNRETAEWDICRGMGTREAIAARGLRSDGIVHWSPKEYLENGWRGLDMRGQKDFDPFAPSRHDFNL
jgi:hypothetical protein